MRKLLLGTGKTGRSSYQTFVRIAEDRESAPADLADDSGLFHSDGSPSWRSGNQNGFTPPPETVDTPSAASRAGNEDWDMLAREQWSGQPGHGLTYVGLFIFTFVLYFRPYELSSTLSGMTSIAFYAAIATLLIYLPSQVSLEGSLTALPVEVKCVLFLCAWALVITPFAKSPNSAWEAFNEHFSKVAIIFVVLVNTLRTRTRIKGLMWLGLAVGAWLSFESVRLYNAGVFNVEGYRVKVDFGGMFGNPNDMAIHLVMFIPIAVGLGLLSRLPPAKLLYFSSAALMTAGIFVTQSRGAFLGLVGAAAILVWKLGKANRLKIIVVSTVVGLAAFFLAPGNYGVRMMSIFIPALDPVSSSDHRWELLTRSVLVALRNPFGIGMGNFSIVGQHNQETHNAYTQVAAELGWLAFAAYMIFLIFPLRKLGALERLTQEEERHRWVNTMSKVLYASIAGYMIASFFGAVAYNWFVYYPVAFAVCLRRLYQVDASPELTKESVIPGV